MKIKKGDNVILVTGKDKGKKGKVIKTFPSISKVIVDGVNAKKKHQKRKRNGEKGQIIEIFAPVNVSNVMIVDPKTSKQSRVGRKEIGQKKVRVSKKSGSEI